MNSGLCLRVLILVALTVPIRAAQPAPETFTLTVPDGPTSTLSGSSVSLLCEVSPLFNAEPLEVRWYRSSNFQSPALLYKDHKIQEVPVDPQYRGRVSLTGGLERGNVSLRLERVTQEDRGEYICQVTSDQWYEKASVFLTVNVTGSEPVLSVAEGRGGGGQVNVTCSSVGWSPQPKLTWRNKDGTEIRNGQEVLNTSDSQGLVNVSSWLLYSPSVSDWLSCTVSLSEEAKREGRILPHIYTAPTAVPGVSKEAFIVTLVLLVLFLVIGALCSVILCKRRGSMWSSSQKSRNSSETKNLIEGAENTVPKPTEQMVTGKEVHLAGAENTVPKPTEPMVTGKDVNLAAETKNLVEGAENSVPKPTEQMAAGKEVNLAGAVNTVPKPTEPMVTGKDVNLAAETKNLVEGAENSVPKPTEQMAAGKEVNLAGAENTVPKPTEPMVTGKDVNLAGAENTVPKPTEPMVTGKYVNLAGAENTVPKTTEPMVTGKDVNLAGAENTVPKPTEPMVTGKDVNLAAETKNLVEGAENSVPKPTEQMAAGKEVNLAGAENTVPKPTEPMVTGKYVNLAGAENTVPKPTEPMVTGKDVNLAAETKNLVEGAENSVPKPTEQMAAGKEVNLAGAENSVPKPTEQMAAGKEVNLAGAENSVPKPTEQMAAGKEVNLAGAENTVPKPTEPMVTGKYVNLAGAENTVPKPTEPMVTGKDVNLAGAVNTVPKPTEPMVTGKDVNLAAETKNLVEGAENSVPKPTEQMAAGKEVNLAGAENTVPKPTEQIAAGKEVNLADWHQVKGFKVPSENIILDIKTVHPAIRVNRGKRATYVKEKDTENPSMRMHLHVFCVESFSSGQHYWEVKVKDQKDKLSWYVGVARENVKRRSNVPLTPQNGFWILSYDKEKGFHVNTDPQTPITVAEITIVGVFLDCDRHTLSFYNVDTESLLYTFTDVKTSNYFPVFSPGQCDKTPLRILE
ncbi:proteoglycan 4-like isoform X49 [Coregonus clupeaformis]|uniref:proteoglycan 4-like isoform X49 n=1 Tax=Coregonus clupeaformis TaxID=59861 RepID=UPI001E1C3A5D|nr:proteoglycan 4-like isoform X49 [Coregonus clupeaformis]